MIAVYCITRDRLELTRKSLKALRGMAGCEFDLYVADNGSGKEMCAYLREAKERGHIYHLQLNGENMGQNIAANGLLDEIMLRPYSWVLRWDNDAMPRTRRFLKKLSRIGDRLLTHGVMPVLSPRISMLKSPPPAKAVAQLEDKDLEIVEMLGGICRLHHSAMFNDFRFSRFAPLGFGEAAEMAKLCSESGAVLMRAPHIEVEHMHGEDGQVEMYPDEFTWERREVGRYVSYGL